MIRYLLIFACLLVVQNSKAQTGLFTFSDSTKLELTVSATSDSQIIFKGGLSYTYDKIAKVNFYSVMKGQQSVVQRLQSKGVAVTVGEKPSDDIDPMYSKSRSIGAGDQSELPNEYLARLKRFEEARSGGKSFQILGALALGVHFILQNKYESDIKNGNLDTREPPKFLPIAACGSLALGIALDIGAGKHLKVRLN